MLRNLAASLFLTEADPTAPQYEACFEVEYDRGTGAVETVVNEPRVKGRVITTVPKAKEVRRLVERCITIAKRGLAAEKAAEAHATSAEPRTHEWEQWRRSDQWRRWVEARAPAVAARRRVFALLRNKAAVRACFEIVAPRFLDRPGGYTRILRLATPRLGDAGPRAILEFVGRHDRVPKTPSGADRPQFEPPEEPSEAPAGTEAAEVPESASAPAESPAAEERAGES